MKTRKESPKTKGVSSAAAASGRIAVPHPPSAGPGVLQPKELPQVDIPGLVIPNLQVRLPNFDIGKPPSLELPVAGPQLSPLQIVGLIPGSTLLNAENARDGDAVKIESLQVPDTTVFAMAVLQGWSLQFANGTELANGNIEFEGAFAQAFLQGRVRVQVAELRTGKKSGPKTLDLRISALLMSGKPRINWSAVIDWSVLLMKLQAP